MVCVFRALEPKDHTDERGHPLPPPRRGNGRASGQDEGGNFFGRGTGRDGRRRRRRAPCDICLRFLIRKFQKEHPHVFFDYQTGVTDRVTERMDMGLIDAAVLVRPFDSVKYDSVPIGPDARWGVIMRADDPSRKKNPSGRKIFWERRSSFPGALNSMQKSQTGWGV